MSFIFQSYIYISSVQRKLRLLITYLTGSSRYIPDFLTHDTVINRAAPVKLELTIFSRTCEFTYSILLILITLFLYLMSCLFRYVFNDTHNWQK